MSTLAPMRTPAQWAELVTTALLGTDRRPSDDGEADPPRAVLEQAARHRVLDRLAGPVQDADSADPTAQPAYEDPAAQDRIEPTEAPEAADRLLADLLRSPDPALIGCWLTACVDRQQVVGAMHWTRLARLAARTGAYDRRLLGRALGPRGRWFLRQNPDWRRLAADATAGDTEPADPVPEAVAPSAPISADEVLADPERIFDQPQPWSAAIVSAAYAVLGGEGQVPPDRSYASRLGVALPAELYPSIVKAGEYYLLAPDASPGRRRTIRDRFVALELAAYARAAIHHAFGSTDADFRRTEIPHV